MKKLFYIRKCLLLLCPLWIVMGYPVLGQTAKPDCPSHSWIGSKCLPFCDQVRVSGNMSCKERDVKSATLTCSKYQHISHWLGSCGPTPCDENGNCSAICSVPPPDRCVDDMHEVTEREWQELMARLKALEKTKP